MTDEYDPSLLILRKCQQSQAHLDFIYKRCKICFEAHAVRHESHCSVDLIVVTKELHNSALSTLTGDSCC